MLCDIIRNVVADQPDMLVVGELPHRAGLLDGVERSQASVVVLGLSDSELPVECTALLATRPQTRVLGVAADGRRAFLYELRPHRTPLGEVSPAGLVEAIRGERVPVPPGEPI